MGDTNVLERILSGLEKPTNLPLALLQEITANFSEEIGKGGFGKVYKGVLQNGNNVAVKRIIVSEHTVDDKLFDREVKNLMKIISHPNVVRFLGFCSNTHREVVKDTSGSEELIMVQIRERLLCFEFISNGSLDKHITDELRGLEWSARYEIIKGICDGLHCLHEENNIIHMDLKPGNIMLDDEMVPKITDFGLSRLGKNTHTSGTRFITQGYCAPEYENGGKTSKKADMYSLGVTIVELITGHKGNPNNDNVLRRWRHRWSKSPMTHTLLSQYHQQVTTCMKIAADCRKEDPADRPSILNMIGILSKTSTNEPTDQTSFYADDDMLGIEPLELRFPFELQKQISCEVKLTNNTKDYYAFDVKMPGQRYRMQPNKGIVSPQSNCIVHITMQVHETALQDMPCVDDFFVHSAKVDGHLGIENITEQFNKEPGKVDKVNFTVVVYEPKKFQRNVSAEAVSKDNEQGQCQPDRRNFYPPKNFSDIQSTNLSYLPRASDRAMDVASGAMGSLLHKLGELLKNDFNLNMNLKKDIKSSSIDLMVMHAALRKVSQVQQEDLDDLVNRWANDARELSYDIEDVIDGFLVPDKPASNTSGFRELTHETLINLLEKGTNHHQISDVIKEIKEKVKEVAEQRDKYRVDSIVANPTTATTLDPRLLALYKDQREIVGIDGTRDELSKRLTDGTDDASKKQLKIISIFGIGGLGKTTLAKAVYERLRAQFDYGAFVSVGRNPDLKKVFKDTLFELDKKKYENIHSRKLEEIQLIDELRRLLASQRYFIVIDDLWGIEACDIIRCALVDNNSGSKVLTTTRILEVAKNAAVVYKLEPLSDDNSKELFYRRLFGGKDKCPYDNFAELSEKILHRCGGIPLAIITMASLLVGKPREDWNKVYESIGFGYGENKQVENMRKILLFSYYDLPCYLKTCLLHLSIFPEDHLINKETLIWKWVAEGFIHKEPGVGLFELGERYFVELINRSMIQPVGAHYSFTPSACRLHDMVLDMICSLSKGHNFVTVLDTDEQHTYSQNSARRLAIQNKVLEQKNLVLGKMPVPQVRSFYATSCDISVAPSFLSFKALRVLAMEGCAFKEDGPCHLEHIGKLHQLRYLGFEHMRIRGLPEEIGDLRFLQTLWLDGTKIKELPHSVALLTQLQCLRAGKCWGLRVPDWIGNLTSLEELSLCNVHSSPNFTQELRKLTGLRDLRITLGSDDENWNKALVESIGNLRKMERLEITSHVAGNFGDDVWQGFVPSRALRTLHLQIRRPRLLSWISYSLLPCLTQLTLTVESLEAQDVETLGRFPELLALELKPHGEGCLMVFTSDDLFPKLRYLNTFAALRFGLGTVSKLEHLQFKVDMRDLQRVHFDFDFSSLRNLPKLEKVLVEMDCAAARPRDVEKAEQSLKHVVDIHPNRPIFDLTKRNEEYILYPEEVIYSENEEEERRNFFREIIQSVHRFCCWRLTSAP